MSVTVEPCGSSRDLLHALVRDGLPELRAAPQRQDRALPRFVERELREFVA